MMDATPALTEADRQRDSYLIGLREASFIVVRLKSQASANLAAHKKTAAEAAVFA
ncbi:hypothetical protein [Salinicola acroporae]|uniref:hypothetical protein n=1 Tax=Salinicola acroporae TaxID=1541440 RepID=UPI0013A5F312|nr:hypothetical protein [Salinicola acroporae]